MTPLRLARRSAERFDALLEGGSSDGLDRELAELLDMVGALRSVPSVEARPEFVVDLRERLMLAAATDLVPASSSKGLDDRLTVTRSRTPRERRLAIALGGFAIVGATTSMAVAAQSALPGDTLYPLKRAMEGAEAGFRVSDDAKGATLLANASGRLDEIDALTRRGDGSVSEIESTLNTFTAQATEASELLLADYQQTGDESSINELRSFTAESLNTLGTLESVIPAEAEDALLHAAQVLYSIDAAAVNACPSCVGGITELPPQLLASTGTSVDEAPNGISGDDSVQAAPHQERPLKPKNEIKGTPEADTTDDSTESGATAAVPGSDAAGGTTGPSKPDQVQVSVPLGSGGGQKQDKGKTVKDVKDVTDGVTEAVDNVVEDVSGVIDGLGLGGKTG